MVNVQDERILCLHEVDVICFVYIYVFHMWIRYILYGTLYLLESIKWGKYLRSSI